MDRAVETGAARAVTPVASLPQVPPFHWRDIANGHALLFMALVIVVYLVLVVALARILLSPAGKNDQYVVVLPPWAQVGRIFELSTAVNGRVIGLNTRTNAYLLYVEGPDAVEALYRSGAWLVLDPTKVGGVLGCGPAPPRPGQGAAGASGARPGGPAF